MSQTVTAAYDSIDKAKNAFDELVSEGYAREELFLDEKENQVKVIVPNPLRSGVEGILKRHEPSDVWARPYTPQ